MFLTKTGQCLSLDPEVRLSPFTSKGMVSCLHKTPPGTLPMTSSRRADVDGSRTSVNETTEGTTDRLGGSWSGAVTTHSFTTDGVSRWTPTTD